MQSHIRLMSCIVLSAFSLLALRTETASAGTPATTAYQFASHPMISGTILTVNDHQMVVNTDQGQQVTLDVDTRTMAPRDMSPGMVMRADFIAQQDCHFYAQRIVAIRSGTALSRPQAYANTRDPRDEGEASARNASAAGGYQRETGLQSLSRHTPGITLSATHSTADFVYSTRPMVSGRVVAVNDHQLIVDTDQGRLVGLLMDSRTMVPGDVAPGTIVRTDFKMLSDGRHYATRVQSISTSAADREQAYAHTTDRDIALAQHALDCGSMSAGPPHMTTSSAIETPGAAAVEPAVATQVEPEPAIGSFDVLPQTASNSPLILLLRLLAIAGAAFLMILRRLTA